MPERLAPTLMVQGTGSGVGKSLLTAALCRIYARRGLHVVPFKAQNMSNNAAVTAAGEEVARAQALQALAAGVELDVRMNPVLLKPLADMRSDVVMLGRSEHGLSAVPWHERKPMLWPIVVQALDSLRTEADLVVIEGAGSPAETNLGQSDIVNMAVARHGESPVLLVADIDRGGAFAALFGTWALLEPDDRRLVRGFILNRFRGDASLVAPAPEDLERRTGVPTLGLIPYLRHRLPEEDATGLASSEAGSITIAAVRLPHVANFDDLDPLAAEAGLTVRWVDTPEGLADAAAIVIPGTRNTIADLRWLWQAGLAAAIRVRHARGAALVGLCGGYQMLGHRVADPHAVEAGGDCAGMGLLDVVTELAPGKTTRQTRASVRGAAFLPDMGADTSVVGYEIHHGCTALGPAASPWLWRDGEAIGAYARANGAPVWGSYLHGLFHNDSIRRAFVASLGGAAARSAAGRIDLELDRLATHVEDHVSMKAIDALVWAG